MDSASAGLLLVVLSLLALWVIVCSVGMAVVCLPMVLYYVAHGLCIALVHAAAGVLGGAEWSLFKIRSSIQVVRFRQHRARAIRRQRHRTIVRQRQARERVDAIFAKAHADMERINVR